MKKRWKILGLVLFAILLLYLHQSDPIQMDLLLSWKPDNPLLAAGMLLMVFTLKSFVVLIPLRLVQILTGHFLAGPAALIVNILGQAIVATIPYWIGNRAGREKVQALLEKYPKVQSVLSFQKSSPFAVCFFLRACSVPMGDLVTMYLGATGMPFLFNVLGSVFGCLPSMALATFLGSNIQQPGSPEFWLSLILNILWIGLSGLGFYLYRKKHSAQKESM